MLRTGERSGGFGGVTSFNFSGEAVMLDISLGGACLLCPFRPPQGRVLDWQFKLPVREGKISCKIKICWTRPCEDQPNYYVTGCQFVEISEEDLKKIEAFIEELTPVVASSPN